MGRSQSGRAEGPGVEMASCRAGTEACTRLGSACAPVSPAPMYSLHSGHVCAQGPVHTHSATYTRRGEGTHMCALASRWEWLPFCGRSWGLGQQSLLGRPGHIP